MNENFLLESEIAKSLFHDYAKDMPIFDYHCHLSPQEIAEDKKYKNITEVWLAGDHYKWRAMRSNGIEEKYITGAGSDYQKFLAWAKTVENCIGNPLYHWTHLELQRFFDINQPLNEDTASKIWEKANKLLAEDDFSARNLMKKMNVKGVCTTDDPIDSLEYHRVIAEDDDFEIKVLATFRPDKGTKIAEAGFSDWVTELEKVAEKKIENYDSFLTALKSRVDFFHRCGCRLADNDLPYVMYQRAEIEELRNIFEKAVNQKELTKLEKDQFRTEVLLYLAELYSELGWVMQLHIGTHRNKNSRMFEKLGADSGFDSISDCQIAKPLSDFLDTLDLQNKLPKTILYNNNPNHNEVIGTMIGNFQGDGIPGKLQFGTAWWFNDHIDGILNQLKTLASLGVLSTFVGMLTDSRSFLSCPRHEYFRRILSNLLGEWIEKGYYPNDKEKIKEIIQDISYNNAENYFDIDLPK